MEDNVLSQQQPPVASHDTFPKHPLVDEHVDSMQYFVDLVLPSESEMNIAHVFFASSDFYGQGDIPSMVPPPSPKVIS